MDPFFWGGSQPFYYRSVNKTEKIVSGCVINRGVVLVDLEKWKSQNITGAIEDLVRLHLTKGHRGKTWKNRCFFGQEIHSLTLASLLMTLLICCYLERIWIWKLDLPYMFMNWVASRKLQSPRRSPWTDLTSGQFGSPLDFKTVCHRSCRPDSKCTDASYQGCDTGPCNQQASFSSSLQISIRNHQKGIFYELGELGDTNKMTHHFDCI